MRRERSISVIVIDGMREKKDHVWWVYDLLVWLYLQIERKTLAEEIRAEQAIYKMTRLKKSGEKQKYKVVSAKKKWKDKPVWTTRL